MALNTGRVGLISASVGYKCGKVGLKYQHTWPQLPEKLAPITARGTWRNNKILHGGGQSCTKFFKTNAFLLTTASTICPEKTPQVWTSPLIARSEKTPKKKYLKQLKSDNTTKVPEIVIQISQLETFKKRCHSKFQ